MPPRFLSIPTITRSNCQNTITSTDLYIAREKERKKEGGSVLGSQREDLYQHWVVVNVAVVGGIGSLSLVVQLVSAAFHFPPKEADSLH